MSAPASVPVSGASRAPARMTCQVGQVGHLCGAPAVGVLAVSVHPSVWELDAEPTPGVVFVCSRHWFGGKA